MAVARSVPVVHSRRLARTFPGGVDLPTWVRLVVLALCTALALLTGGIAASAPWLVSLAAIGVVYAVRRGGSPSFLAAMVSVELLYACIGVLATGPAGSPLLPYVLAPMAVAGREFGNRAVLALTAVGGFVLGTGVWALSERVDERDSVAASLEWLALGLASGLLTAWATRVRRRGEADELAQQAEAQRLLLQLRALAGQLPGSLDPATTAGSLLDRCAALTPHERSVVLTHYDGTSLVPVAVRGVTRLPWRDPTSAPGTLQQAWTTMTPVLDVRPPDEHPGDRRGSALLAVPMRAADGSPLALAAFESTRLDAFDGDAADAIERQVREEVPRLETALLFADLRHTATLEERERLAREMHDGVAQDLAYFGFALDDLRQQLTDTDPARAKRVAELRGELTTMIADIRLSITDLRSSIGPERGLGTALSSYVRLAGSTGPLTVHLSLREGSLRLPSEHEVGLFRVTQEFVSLVRRSPRARNLWVTLETDPPGASLRLEQDGLDSDGLQGSAPAAEEKPMRHEPELDRIADQVGTIGGTLAITTPEPGRLRIDVTLTGGAP